MSGHRQHVLRAFGAGGSSSFAIPSPGQAETSITVKGGELHVTAHRLLDRRR